MLSKIKNITNSIINPYFQRIKSEKTERNRFLMLSFASLFLIDYLLFCYISSKNPINIFPVIPLLEDIKTINIYIPDIDGNTIIKETRRIAKPDNNEAFVRTLIDGVIKGSNIENTSIAVPVDLFIRKIWFYQDACIIDTVPSLPSDIMKITPGSEKNFTASLERTITENISSVKKVILLERGIPGRNIWETAL
jgi:hypothetical protein